LLSTRVSEVEFEARVKANDSPQKGVQMLTSFILMFLKLLSSPVLVAALAKFLANALKSLS
jgi:hypothetical protein